MEDINKPSTFILGQIIKEHRLEQRLSQEQAAERLEIDVKTLSSWERGQVAAIRLSNRMRLHETLGISSRILGLSDHFTPEGAMKLDKRIHAFLEQGAYSSAWEASNVLIEGCSTPASARFPLMRSILAHAFYTKGLATSVLTNEPQKALRLYVRMESIANEQADSNGLAIAQTYQADMYRRLGQYEKALELLKGVEARFKSTRLSTMDARVAGNCYQLLARVHLARREKGKAVDVLKRAEDLAQVAEPDHLSDWYLCFCLCGVKEELTKTLMLLRQYKTGFEACEALQLLARSAAPRWAIPATITQGELLVRFARSCDDRASYKQGLEALAKGYRLAQEHNHVRQQQRVMRLLTKWEGNDGFRLEYSQKLRERIGKFEQLS